MNMFKPAKAKTLKEYFASIPADKQKTMIFLDAFIKKVAPSLKPYFATNMPGYGSFQCKNYKKEIIQWPIISLACRKDYISIYVCAIKGKEYVAEKYKKELGALNVGKSCISVSNIEDLNLKVLEKVIKFAEKKPGLVKE
jgi:hypothetical protein